MKDGLYRAAVDACAVLSPANFEALGQALRDGASPLDLRAFARGLPQRPQREALERLATAWDDESRDVGGQAIRWCLVGLRRRMAEEPSPRMVWSGPSSTGTPYRSTEQVIKEMLSGASTSLTVVSFATRDVESLREPLAAAMTRGVSVRMIVEHHDAMNGVSWEPRLRRLGSEILSNAAIYVWPLDRRPSSGGEARGSMHAKCLLADSRRMLLTSANWTLAAMESNMELGVLIDDEAMVRRVSLQLDSLIDSGEFSLWRP